MKSKFFTLALCLIVLIGSPVFAQNDSLIVIGTAGEIGSTNNIVPINLNNEQIIQGIELTLNFDMDLLPLEVTTTERTSEFVVEAPYSSGSLRIVLISLQGHRIFPGTGPILEINFNVSPTAIPGNYLLDLTEVLAVDSWAEEVPVDPVDGIFRVESGVIPVELSAFSATYSEEKKRVELAWHTCSEQNNYGFEVQRSSNNNDFSKIGFVPGNGTTSSAQDYAYYDTQLSAANYFYRLKQIDFDGTFVFSETVEVNTSNISKYSLSQNYPNPFSAGLNKQSTTIHFDLPAEDKVEIKIFDVLGREVKTLVAEVKPQGSHSIMWDGKDKYGAQVSTGIYYYQMKATNFSTIQKMLILN